MLLNYRWYILFFYFSVSILGTQCYNYTRRKWMFSYATPTAKTFFSTTWILLLEPIDIVKHEGNCSSKVRIKNWNSKCEKGGVSILRFSAYQPRSQKAALYCAFCIRSLFSTYADCTIKMNANNKLFHFSIFHCALRVLCCN